VTEWAGTEKHEEGKESTIFFSRRKEKGGVMRTRSPPRERREKKRSVAKKRKGKKKNKISAHLRPGRRGKRKGGGMARCEASPISRSRRIRRGNQRGGRGERRKNGDWSASFWSKGKRKKGGKWTLTWKLGPETLETTKREKKNPHFLPGPGKKKMKRRE